MKIFARVLALFLLTTFVLGLTGCLNKDMDDSSIPWSRPADWENQVPGMGRGF